MRGSKSGRKIEKRILEKIEKNIKGIYRNKRVMTHIKKLREMFKIPDNLFKNHKAELVEIYGIDDLLNQLTDIWANSIPEKGPIITEINKNIAKLHIEYEVGKKEAKEIGLSFPTRKNYAVDILKNFIKGRSIIYYLMKRNSDIWKKVISANLLTIPLMEILKHKESILEDYLPRVDNEMIIKIHELTTQNDLKYIWPEIKEKKRKFQIKYDLKNVKKEYPNYKRDKRAYELHILKGFSQEKTRRIMIDEMPNNPFPKKSDYSYIGKIVEKYKRYIGEM